MKTPARLAAAALVAATLPVIASTPAHAGDNEVIRTGSCSGSADWKIKAKPDDGRLEVEFEVDQNVVGDTWAVRIFDDGERIFAGRRTTRAPSGSFTVELRTNDRPGTDDFVGRARNLSTGEVCRGTLAF